MRSVTSAEPSGASATFVTSPACCPETWTMSPLTSWLALTKRAWITYDEPPPSTITASTIVATASAATGTIRINGLRGWLGTPRFLLPTRNWATIVYNMQYAGCQPPPLRPLGQLEPAGLRADPRGDPRRRVRRRRAPQGGRARPAPRRQPHAGPRGAAPAGGRGTRGRRAAAGRDGARVRAARARRHVPPARRARGLR